MEEKTRQSMWKLRMTWGDVLPNNVLYGLDSSVRMLDPAWPLTATEPTVESPPASIHVNPRFLKVRGSKP